MKKLLFVAVMITALSLTGCGTTVRSFQQGSGAQGETMILLREGLEVDQALREVIFVLTRHGFDPEMINSEVGFVRTRWNHEWNDRGTHIDDYRVRIVTSFNPSRTQLILNAEAEMLRGRTRGRENWVRGFDTRAIETLRNDLNMVIGN